MGLGKNIKFMELYTSLALHLLDPPALCPLDPPNLQPSPCNLHPYGHLPDLLNLLPSVRRQ